MIKKKQKTSIGPTCSSNLPNIQPTLGPLKSSTGTTLTYGTTATWSNSKPLYLNHKEEDENNRIDKALKKINETLCLRPRHPCPVKDIEYLSIFKRVSVCSLCKWGRKNIDVSEILEHIIVEEKLEKL